MPAALPVTNKAKEFLDGRDPAAQEVARLAVTGATSVKDAVERVSLLDGMAGPIVAEARAVLEGLPQAIDRALLAALQSALARKIPVGLEWEEGPVFGLRIMEAADSSVSRVDIMVITPHGDTFEKN